MFCFDQNIWVVFFFFNLSDFVISLVPSVDVNLLLVEGRVRIQASKERGHMNWGFSYGKPSTRVELLALWASLYITKDIGLPYLHIFGDSSVIINLEKGESTLDIVNLEAWCLNTKMLMYSFTLLDFSHVYREHNKRADILSKEGLCRALGHLLLTESYDDEFIGEVSIHLF